MASSDDTGGEIKMDPMCDLFRTGDPTYETESKLGRCWLTMSSIIMATSTVAIANAVANIPLRAGLHKYAIAGTLGFFFGEWARGYRNRVAVERDFQFYHYMMLHPEDFPPPRKILFRDYLEPWDPTR